MGCCHGDGNFSFSPCLQNCPVVDPSRDVTPSMPNICGFNKRRSWYAVV